MFTIILYKETAAIDLQRYKFLFANFQMNDQLALCEWSNGMTLENIVIQINFLADGKHTWKLIVVDTGLTEKEKDSGLEEIVRLYSGRNNAHRRFRIEGYLPEWVWYIRCKGKKDRCDFPTIQEETCCLRYFVFDIDTDGIPYQRFSMFSLNCMILILSMNEVPAFTLDPDTFYQLEITVDQSGFSYHEQ